MRVIAGQYRSRPLAAPRGQATRPTSDRLRETLFNVLGARVEGAVFADLYAGSGANGIEALSRGAAEVVFVEASAAAAAAIRANLERLEVRRGGSLETRKAASWLRSRATGATFDIIFLDPPYDAAEEYATVLGLLGGEARALLAPGAVVVAEHRRKHPPAGIYGALNRYRLLEQGDAALSFYSISPPAAEGHGA